MDKDTNMIMWELLLKDEDVCDALKRMYAESSVNIIATHLGVSRIALIRKMKECGIVMRKRGGAHPRIELDTLADRWWEKSTDELVSMTGYCSNYVRKLKRKKLMDLEAKKCNSVSITNTDSPDSPNGTKDS